MEQSKRQSKPPLDRSPSDQKLTVEKCVAAALQQAKYSHDAPRVPSTPKTEGSSVMSQETSDGFKKRPGSMVAAALTQAIQLKQSYNGAEGEKQHYRRGGNFNHINPSSDDAIVEALVVRALEHARRGTS